jgi:hypothetical protein
LEASFSASLLVAAITLISSVLTFPVIFLGLGESRFPYFENMM